MSTKKQNDSGVSKTDLFALLKDVERAGVKSKKLKELEQLWEDAEDDLSEFQAENEEYNRLTKRVKELSKKSYALRQRERAEFMDALMRMKALIRTEGASPVVVKAVRSFAKRFGIL